MRGEGRRGDRLNTDEMTRYVGRSAERPRRRATAQGSAWRGKPAAAASHPRNKGVACSAGARAPYARPALPGVGCASAQCFPQNVENTVRFAPRGWTRRWGCCVNLSKIPRSIAVTARLIALRAVRSLCKHAAASGFGALPQTPQGALPLDPLPLRRGLFTAESECGGGGSAAPA